MKVLVNNYKKNDYIKVKSDYPKKTICERCKSELEYEESDIYIGAFGCAHIDCPLCGSDNPIYDEGAELTLTKDNVEFPTHFWHTSTETGAVDCCNNEEIKKYINTAINYFRKNKNDDDYHWFVETGNLHIEVIRLSGDESYEVLVTKDYYSTSIPFGKEDY
jgi:hypothetical protein